MCKNKRKFILFEKLDCILLYQFSLKKYFKIRLEEFQLIYIAVKNDSIWVYSPLIGLFARVYLCDKPDENKECKKQTSITINLEKKSM
jgi:hypothetical protein